MQVACTPVSLCQNQTLNLIKTLMGVREREEGVKWVLDEVEGHPSLLAAVQLQ